MILIKRSRDTDSGACVPKCVCAPARARVCMYLRPCACVRYYYVKRLAKSYLQNEMRECRSPESNAVSNNDNNNNNSICKC